MTVRLLGNAKRFMEELQGSDNDAWWQLHRAIVAIATGRKSPFFHAGQNAAFFRVEIQVRRKGLFARRRKLNTEVLLGIVRRDNGRLDIVDIRWRDST